MSSENNQQSSDTFLGHPPGLFALFFAEMWERFSYYGMRALLLFYMIKGFLSYSDGEAYAVYGAYTALVYMTPFFGGMIADRILGARKAVVLGGLLMAAGHLMMTIETDLGFFFALALLIVGNGFFKPNISTIVGALYPERSPKRDAGFTIFYIGINLGAAMSPLLCGYIGETYGWHYGFGLATIGMLLGLAVFWNWVPPDKIGSPPNEELLSRKPVEVTQGMIFLGACFAGISLLFFHPINVFNTAINFFVGIALIVAGVVACIALRKGAGGFINLEWTVYICSLLFVPIFTLLVSGFAPFTENNEPITIIPAMETGSNVVDVVLEEISRPAGLILFISGIGSLLYLLIQTFKLQRIPQERMYVVLILTFFSMLFWAFFEQAGSSINNFTDRNVDRVIEEKKITEADVGETIKFRVLLETDEEELQKLPPLTQEQLGYQYGNESLSKQIGKAVRQIELEKQRVEGKKTGDVISDLSKKVESLEKQVGELRKQIEEGGAPPGKKEKPKKMDKEKEEVIINLVKNTTKDNYFTMTGLTYLREVAKQKNASLEQKTVTWEVTEQNIGMGVGGSEIPASVFQAINPIYILLFGVVFSALWTFLGNRGMEPTTPVKFALGLLQLGLGFAALWYGAQLSNERGMVALSWLFLGYLLHTTGELCLSPVGLSMVTKLSPAFLVSTVMGMWFLATAFSQFLAAIIAQFTRVSEGGSGTTVPVPVETVDLYGNVFGTIGITAIISSLVCFLLAPLLSYWMHEGKDDDGEPHSVVPPGPPGGEDLGEGHQEPGPGGY